MRQALEHLLAEAARRLSNGSPLVIEVCADERRDGLWGMVCFGGSIQDGDASSAVGLRLASRIAEAHGGTLATEHPIDGTLQFRLALPGGGPVNR